MVPCQIGRHKGVNRVVEELTVRNRCALADCGNRRPGERLERPMIRAGGAQAGRIGRPDRSLFDPTSNHRNRGRVESLSLGGHADGRVDRGDPLHQAAFAAFAGHNVHAVLAAAERRLAPVETQAALLLFFAVAGKAARRENRPHLAREVDPFSGGRSRPFGRQRTCGRSGVKQNEERGRTAPRDSADSPHRISPRVRRTAQNYGGSDLAGTGCEWWQPSATHCRHGLESDRFRRLVGLSRASRPGLSRQTPVPIANFRPVL